MNLKDLAKQPQLITITLDDEDLVKEFGEPLTFHTYDRQPMDTFLKVAGSKGNDVGAMIDVLKTMVLDSEGEPVIKDGLMLPSKVMVAVFAKLVEELGK